MSVHSTVLLKQNDPVGIFMRTASRVPVGRDWGALAPRKTSLTPSTNPAFALIQAALPKAAWTNAMLADVLFPHRLAGASRSGACNNQPTRSALTTPANARARCALGVRGAGRSVILNRNQGAI